MSASSKTPARTQDDVDRFLEVVRKLPPAAAAATPGRLVLAMDATMSRQPTWDQALAIQAAMFEEAGKAGGLDVQLVYFRGFNECRASRWTSDAAGLASLMTGIECRGGNTQIARVLKHLRAEAGNARVNAAVYIGDALEEPIDPLAQIAGEIGLLGVPVFMFHEGRNAAVEQGYREIARLTKGAYFRFDTGAAKVLRELLTAVAAYASGGRSAMMNLPTGGGTARLLLEQMK